MNLMCFFDGQNNSVSLSRTWSPVRTTDFAREFPLQITDSDFCKIVLCGAMAVRNQGVVVAVIASCKGWEALMMLGWECISKVLGLCTTIESGSRISREAYSQSSLTR